MILQALVQYYEDLVQQGKIAKPGWSKTKVNFALCINERGELQQIIPLLEEAKGKKPQPQQMDLPAPVKRASNIAANFLWDNSSYLLGIDEKGKPEHSFKCFQACKKLHHQLLDGICDSDAIAILRFFDTWTPDQANENAILRNDAPAVTAGGNLVFRINGKYANMNQVIRQAWQSYYDTSAGKKRQCLVTGREDSIEPIHPAIKGVYGAQSSGAALVSFNAPAFCSYGQEQNLNAPIGKSAAFAYTSALNYLLGQKENVQHIGDASVICWAESAEEQYQSFSAAALFGQDNHSISEDDLRDAVKKLAQGKPVPEWNLVPDRRFYILGISPNAARLAVRFFYADSFGNLMKNINRHYERLEIIHDERDFATIPLWALLKETVNSKSTDKTPNPVMAGAVARAVFSDGLYPMALLEQTMVRIRAEQNITRGRAAIIKAFYLKNKNKDCPKEVLTVALNEDSTNPAYLLGRLFSIYESIQKAANPGVNTTIKDKYFNSAASTPATIFPLLDNLCQKHLRKLETGRRIWYEQRILDVTEKLTGFPARLTLPQQGAFDLGYYHQTKKRYEKKEEQ